MTIAAWVDGEPLEATEVEERLARLRSRDRARSLPDPHTREGRQLRRWVAQVAVVERLCARVSGSAPDHTDLADQTWPPAALSRADAAALGSIVAAAWADPTVRRAAAVVTAGVGVPPDRQRVTAELAATDEGGPAWSADDLVTSARLEAFARWLARATHERVRLAEGFEHPGDATQPDNLHEH